TDVDLSDIQADRADLSATLLDRCRVDRAVLTRTDLSLAKVNACTFAGTDLTEADLERFTALETDLSQVTFRGNKLDSAMLMNAKLAGQRFPDCTLELTLFIEADLQ